MASAVYTTVDVIDLLKLTLDDTGGDLLTAAQYNAYILKHIIAKSQNFKLTEIVTGTTYTYMGDPVWIYGIATTEGEDDKVYEVNCQGTILVTTGAHAAGDITVTGALVDFPELMVEICVYLLAQHKAQEMSVTLGDGSMSPEEVHRKLVSMAEYWRGVTAI
jgi:hypothetical protein